VDGWNCIECYSGKQNMNLTPSNTDQNISNLLCRLDTCLVLMIHPSLNFEGNSMRDRNVSLNQLYDNVVMFSCFQKTWASVANFIQGKIS
jgi:hypothetical protein